MITKFIPNLNVCLIDPLKLIFNFGNINSEYENYNDNFDLDIKVVIEDRN